MRVHEVMERLSGFDPNAEVATMEVEFDPKVVTSVYGSETTGYVVIR